VRRPLPLLLAALLVLPAAPAAAEPAPDADGPSLLATLGVAYLEGVQLGALVAAAQEEEPGEAPVAPCPPAEEELPAPEDGDETVDGEETQDAEETEETQETQETQDAEATEETEEGEPCLEEDPQSAEDEEEVDDLDDGPEADQTLDDDLAEAPEAGAVTHGTIVSTVARCAPRGLALRGLADGLRNHGAYVRAAAHGDELTIGDETYDLATLDGAEALCASFDAAVEDEEPASDEEPATDEDPGEEIDEGPETDGEDEQELTEQDGTLGTASVATTPETRGRSGDAPGRADAGPRGKAKKDAGPAGPAVERSSPAPRGNAGGNGKAGGNGNGKGKGR
jgi:hypothetical protein